MVAGLQVPAHAKETMPNALDGAAAALHRSFSINCGCLARAGRPAAATRLSVAKLKDSTCRQKSLWQNHSLHAREQGSNWQIVLNMGWAGDSTFRQLLQLSGERSLEHRRAGVTFRLVRCGT